MAEFRRYFIVLAVLALMVGSASAQVGVANGSAASLFACVATAAGTPQLRPEGFTELIGDIVISCTGGPVLAQTSVVPTTNITVYMANGAPITSRYLAANGASEALLLIDEPGSGINTGATGGYGPQAPQTLCTTAQQQQSGGSACTAFVGKDASGTYAVTVTASGGTTPAANVYQGKVGDFGANSVTFYAVPVLPPATSGVARTFRVTNVRIPVPNTATGSAGAQLQAVLSTSPSTVLPVSGTALNIGVVGKNMTAAVTAQKTFQQCLPQTRQLSANLIFTEGFATAFKTRVIPGGASNGVPGGAPNTQWAGEAQNLAAPINQNIPGGLYGGFAQNSESGFIFPALVSTASSTTVAGLADYGTRLKAVFTNIPAGLSLFVSTTSAAPVPAPPGGTSVLPYAVLVATSSSDVNSDGAAFTPITGTVTGSDGLNAIALVTDSTGKATAIWEVVNANPSATDVLTFSVYISYTAAGTPPPYGTPITDLPPGIPLNNVALSLAPEPGGGTVSVTGLQGFFPIPRFIVTSNQGGRWVSVNLCQTTLLYPFVTGAAGFDTGVAVANTSADPFGTVNQAGSCTLYAYGGAGTTQTQAIVPGCDTFGTGVPGTNCFDIVYAGQVKSVMAATVLPGFTGYVIAVCNFQYAHGYAAVTDLGLRNLWSSYLALELAPPQSITCTNSGSSSTCTTSGGVGSPRAKISSIEELVH